MMCDRAQDRALLLSLGLFGAPPGTALSPRGKDARDGRDGAGGAREAAPERR
jgi:hypothetical protein